MTKALTPSGKDITHSLVKGGLGSIPIVGSMAAEIFNLIIAPPLERRKSEWMNEIAAKLTELSDKYAVDLNSLKDDDLFLDAVLQATTYALKTSEKEKIIAFQNAILHIAAGDSPDKTVTQIFLNQLDNLTIWHIRILKFIENPKNWFHTFNRTPPSYGMASLSTLFIDAFPELKDKNDLLDIVWNDLRNAGFHRAGDVNTSMTGDGLFSERTTNLGQQFIKFISDYKP